MAARARRVGPGDVNVAWLAAAVAAQLVSFACLAQTQRHLLAAGGLRVRLRSMLGLTLEANAINATVPAGSAVAAGYSVRRLRSWGASGSAAAFAVLASGAMSTVAFGALLAVWAGTAGGAAGRAALWVAAPGTVLAGLAVVQRNRLLAVLAAVVRLGHRLRRRPPGPILERISRFAAEMRAVRPLRRQWCAGFGHAALNWLGDLACLAASCIAVGGARPSLGLMTAAYVAGLAATALSILPAGLGGTEAAMIATLTGGGMRATSALAIVVCYRLISVAFVVGLGWALCARSRWRDKRRRATATGNSADLSRADAS